MSVNVGLLIIMEIFVEIRCICCLICANKLLTVLDGKFVLVLLRLSVFYS